MFKINENDQQTLEMFERYARKGTYHGFSVCTEKSVPRNQSLAMPDSDTRGGFSLRTEHL